MAYSIELHPEDRASDGHGGFRPHAQGGGGDAFAFSIVKVCIGVPFALSVSNLSTQKKKLCCLSSCIPSLPSVQSAPFPAYNAGRMALLLMFWLGFGS
jgi:hypothetical protein